MAVLTKTEPNNLPRHRKNAKLGKQVPERRPTKEPPKPSKLKKYMEAIKYEDRDMVHYVLLVLIRIVLVFVPQLGYVHPDEFFQTIEVVAGDEYRLDVNTPWEYNQTFPIRSAALPFLYLRIPMNFFNLICRYIYFLWDIDLRTSYWLLVIPRLIMCSISFLNDFSLYKICQGYGLQHSTRLLALGSSYVILVYGTRTFSNAMEMALCSLLLYLVSDCMILSNTVIYQKQFLEEKYHKAKSIVERVRFFKLKSALPSHSFNKCFLVATICVLGFFNRPTFIVFGMPIVFQWLHRGMGRKSVSFFDFNLRIGLFLLCSMPALIFCIVTDSFYFKFLTIAEIENADISIHNFVFTPLNFLRYNIDSNNTAQHGEHPKWVHVLVNIPILYNILGIVAIITVGNMMYNFSNEQYRNLPRAQSIMGLMTSSIIVPVIALSFINHQEPRFLIPITVPIIILHAPKLRLGFLSTNPFKNRYWLYDTFYEYVLSHKVSSKYLLRTWIIINLALTIFFGFVHQGGVTQLAQHFSMTMATKGTSTHVHLVTSHMYDIPHHLLMLPSTSILHTNPDTGHKYRKSKEFFLHECGSLELNRLVRKVKLLLDVNEMRVATGKGYRYKLFLAIPTSLAGELNQAFYNNTKSLVTHMPVKIFYPHLSTEALPNFYNHHPNEIILDDLSHEQENQRQETSVFSASGVLKQFSSIVHQFGLVLYRIEVKKTKRKPK